MSNYLKQILGKNLTKQQKEEQKEEQKEKQEEKTQNKINEKFEKENYFLNNFSTTKFSNNNIIILLDTYIKGNLLKLFSTDKLPFKDFIYIDDINTITTNLISELNNTFKSARESTFKLFMSFKNDDNFYLNSFYLKNLIICVHEYQILLTYIYAYFYNKEERIAKNKNIFVFVSHIYTSLDIICYILGKTKRPYNEPEYIFFNSLQENATKYKIGEIIANTPSEHYPRYITQIPSFMDKLKLKIIENYSEEVYNKIFSQINIQNLLTYWGRKLHFDKNEFYDNLIFLFVKYELVTDYNIIFYKIDVLNFMLTNIRTQIILSKSFDPEKFELTKENKQSNLTITADARSKLTLFTRPNLIEPSDSTTTPDSDSDERPKLFTEVINGGNKFKSTKNKITVIYKKKQYTRVIYISERKKYVKINKTYLLLSKLKKV